MLKKLRVFVSGDIGCYTLGALEPFNSVHASTCMGASISMAHGMAKVQESAPAPAAGARPDYRNKVVGIIGDSTFYHSGITSLMDVAYNNGNTLTIIVDNSTTAMTGGQENPGTGKTLLGEPSQSVDLEALVRALGIKRVHHHRRPVRPRAGREVLREETGGRRSLGGHRQVPVRSAVQDQTAHLSRWTPNSASAASAACRPAAWPSTSSWTPAGDSKVEIDAGPVQRLRGLRPALQRRRHQPAGRGRRREGLMTRPTINMLLSGVGGQGVVLASFVLSHVAMAEGYDVKQSEVHGMSQRGGSVTSHFRFGDKVWAPLVSPGAADILMAFESLEALRYINWLKPGGLLVYNAQKINPSPVSAGLATYPEDIDGKIAAAWPRVQCVKANELAGAGRHGQVGQRGHARRRVPGAAVRAARPGKRSSARRCRPRAWTSTWRPSGWAWPLPPTPPPTALPAPRSGAGLCGTSQQCGRTAPASRSGAGP